MPATAATPAGCAEPARPLENARRRVLANSAKWGGSARTANRRRIRDTAALLPPGELQRPFKEPYASEEPDWLAAELAPPKLAIEG